MTNAKLLFTITGSYLWFMAIVHTHRTFPSIVRLWSSNLSIWCRIWLTYLYPLPTEQSFSISVPPLCFSTVLQGSTTKTILKVIFLSVHCLGLCRHRKQNSKWDSVFHSPSNLIDLVTERIHCNALIVLILYLYDLLFNLSIICFQKLKYEYCEKNL